MRTGRMVHKVPPDPPRKARTTVWTRVLSLGVVGIVLFYLFTPAALLMTESGPIGAAVGGGFILGGLILRLFLFPFALYKDSTMTGQESTWTPSVKRYVFGSIVLPSVVGAYYLYRRFRNVGTPEIPGHKFLRTEDSAVRSNWWVIIISCWLADPFAVVAVAAYDPSTKLTLSTLSFIYPIIIVSSLLLTVRMFILPFATYFDAKAVKNSRITWDPGPITLAVGMFLFPLGVAPYYLVRRWPTLPSISTTHLQPS